MRDAQGNVMAIYKRSIRNDAMEFELTEQHIYGSTRLGVDRRNVDMIAAATPSDNGAWQVKRGEKHYELSNHLGNVLATVSDKKIAVMNGANLSYYRADVVSYSDYYPFGAPMTERTASVSDVRYGFNGQEKDDEIANGLYTAEFWEYDSRLGRRWNIDPVMKPFESPYSTFGDNPILNVDPEGNDWFKNESSGETQWADVSGKQGEQVSLKGSQDTWTNLGTEFLEFSGDKFTYSYQTTDDKGNFAST